MEMDDGMRFRLFDEQVVGLQHILQDGDVVMIVTAR
jgi:ribosome-interacting GTPase 1